MFKRSIRISNCLKFIAKENTKIKQINAAPWKYYQRAISSLASKDPIIAESFGAFLHRRREEALRTIVFQVNTANVYEDVQKYCSHFGSVNEAFYYQSKQNGNLILVEFENRESADEIIRSQLWGGEHTERTRFPKFNSKALSKTLPKLDSSAKIVELNTTEGKAVLSKTDTHELLLQAESVGEQIEILFRQTAINDLFTRLRFLAMAQIEDAIKGVCPNARTYPFGSSASGFGRQKSDLDMVLVNHNFTVPSMASIMEFQPGIYNMVPLHNATVPIIKYHHSLLNIETDISFDNLRGVYGTELLYFCGQIDDRLRPLIFTLRWWADVMNVTRATPGPWIKNYGMNLLTIFYLQQLEKPILPPLRMLDELKREPIEDHGVCFIKNIKGLDFKTENTDSMEELIIGFFKFYANFEFKKTAVCIERGELVEKVDSSSIDIIDLFGTENVASNVGRKYFGRLKKGFNATNALEFDLKNERKLAKENWGLVKFFQCCDDVMFQTRTHRSVSRP